MRPKERVTVKRVWLLLLWMMIATCESQHSSEVYNHQSGENLFFKDNLLSPSGNSNDNGRRFQHNFNSTKSFISRSSYGLEAESRHRKFTLKELSRLFRSAGCPNDEIFLVCKNINETIVIENASFYSLPSTSLNCSNGPIGPISSGTIHGTDPLRQTFFPHLLGLPRLSRDLRQALNRRCSGLGKGEECSFNLALDHPESKIWGTGLIDIFYRCVPYEKTSRFCDREVKVRADPEGSGEFLMSPVYPKYYNGDRKCRWLLKALPGQRIHLRFLDISLRERISSSDPECTDSVSVSERGKTLMRMCGESNEDIMLLSDGHTLEVNLDIRTKTIFSRRGILAEFWPVGCPNQYQPQDGYLQFRNDSQAVFSCSLGYVFLPSLDRSKIVKCVDRKWTQEVGNCFSFEFIRKYGNQSVVSMLNARWGTPPLNPSLSVPSSSSFKPRPRQTIPVNWFSEVVMPVIVVVIVVIISLFAMIVLLLLRRHLHYENESRQYEEDRSALTPASLRRNSPLLQLDVAHHLVQSSASNHTAALNHLGNGLQSQREELFLC